MPRSEPNSWHGSRKVASDDYTRCGTPLVYADRLELQPDILVEFGEQKKPDQDASPFT